MKAIIAAAALGSIGLPATAQEVRFEVQYRDLDLTTAAGQDRLEKRIETAARKACGLDAHATGTRIRSRQAQGCVTELRAKARAQFAVIVADEGKGG